MGWRACARAVVSPGSLRASLSGATCASRALRAPQPAPCSRSMHALHSAAAGDSMMRHGRGAAQPARLDPLHASAQAVAVAALFHLPALECPPRCWRLASRISSRARSSYRFACHILTRRILTPGCRAHTGKGREQTRTCEEAESRAASPCASSASRALAASSHQRPHSVRVS